MIFVCTDNQIKVLSHDCIYVFISLEIICTFRSIFYDCIFYFFQIFFFYHYPKHTQIYIKHVRGMNCVVVCVMNFGQDYR